MGSEPFADSIFYTGLWDCVCTSTGCAWHGVLFWRLLRTRRGGGKTILLIPAAYLSPTHFPYLLPRSAAFGILRTGWSIDKRQQRRRGGCARAGAHRRDGGVFPATYQPVAVPTAAFYLPLPSGRFQFLARRCHLRSFSRAAAAAGGGYRRAAACERTTRYYGGGGTACVATTAAHACLPCVPAHYYWWLRHPTPPHHVPATMFLYTCPYLCLLLPDSVAPMLFIVLQFCSDYCPLSHHLFCPIMP